MILSVDGADYKLKNLKTQELKNLQTYKLKNSKTYAYEEANHMEQSDAVIGLCGLAAPGADL